MRATTGPADFEGTPSGGRIIYLVKMFPRLSETFIVNEAWELRRRGLDLRILSLLRPSGEIQSDRALALARDSVVLPDPGTRQGARSLLRDQIWLAKRFPVRYHRSLLLVARRFSSSAWKRFFQAGAVARYAVESEAAHIHAGFAHVPASVAFWASRMTGIPFSFAAHAKDLYLSDRRSLLHKMNAARFVHTCTEANGEYLRGLGSTTPVIVAYHGVDLSAWTDLDEQPRAGDKKRLLAVGRLVPKKGFETAIEALAILRRGGHEIELDLVGDGPERSKLRELADRHGLNGAVLFHGSRPPHALREHYANADVMVLPSIQLANGDRDGIPNVLVEAMAMGVPVVSTRVSAIPELVRDGETGLLANPRDPVELADAIAKAIADPAASRERARLARLDVEERFDLRRNSARLADTLLRHARPTRSLYVCADGGIPVRGHKGASAHVRQVCEGLLRAGVQTSLLAASPGPEAPEGNAFPLPIESLQAPAWADRLLARARSARAKAHARELRRLVLNWRAFRRVSEILHTERPDFVYERYSLCSFATGLACRRLGVPWILEVNAPLAQEEETFRDLRWKGLTRRIERWILVHADRVFVVSHALRRWAIEMGVHPDRVQVLGNGVDIRRFHPGVDGQRVRNEWGIAPEEIVVAFSGSLKPWHGGKLLLDAFDSARRVVPGLRLVYIGDGPERKEIEKRARRLGVQPLVSFTGAVAQDRVPEMLRAADILAAPYLPQDQFYFSPLKVLEYLATGRPIVASQIGDLTDLVDGECGRLVPPGRVEALSAALRDLALDPTAREAMGAAAARRGRMEDWSSRVESILREVPAIRLRHWPRAARAGYILKMFPRFSETFVVNEVVELERQGLDLQIFSMKRPSGLRQEQASRVRAPIRLLPTLAGALRPATIGAHTRSFLRSPSRYLRALYFAVGRRDVRAMAKFAQAGVVADVARRAGIGHLHAHFASGPARVAKMASMISGIPFSFTAHAKDLYWEGHNHSESHKLKKRVKLARFVVTISRENQRYLEGLGFRVKEGRIRPIHIGLRLEEFPFRLPSELPRTPRPLILAVGRLIEKKGFGILLDALDELRARGVRFRCVIAGEGPLRETLAASILAKRLEGSVILAGAVPLHRLRAHYYRRARVLAQPCVIAADGDRDGIPTVILEAMAMGVPVVSTAVSGIPEAIDDGRSGFLAQPGDAAALAERIALLLGDPSLADRIAREGRARVEEAFDLQRNAGALRKLILRSIHGWPPPAAEPPQPTPESTTGVGGEIAAEAGAGA